MEDDQFLPAAMSSAKEKQRLSNFDSADELLRAIVQDLAEDPNRFARIRAQVIKMSTWRALNGSRKRNGEEHESQGTPAKDLMLLTVILQEIASFAHDQYGARNVLLPNEMKDEPVSEFSGREKLVGEQLTAAVKKRGGIDFDAFNIFKPQRSKKREEEEE